MSASIRKLLLFLAAEAAGVVILYECLYSSWGQSQWWVPSLGMCLVVAGILGYLGTHVLARKVIFVDLATAQLAALGAAYAIFLDYEPEHEENQLAIFLFS